MNRTSRLDVLAAGNAMRTSLLGARAARHKQRWRMLMCPTCGQSEHSYRGAGDICDECLMNLWNADAVLRGEFKAGKKSGLIALWVPQPGRAHDMEYPHLATSGEEVPKKAYFVRSGSFDKPADTSHSMQVIYQEIGIALTGALPCDPVARETAEPLISRSDGVSHYNPERQYFRLPIAAVKSLRDLWGLIQWHSAEAYKQGFDAGHDLLKRMNLGDATFEQFQAEIAEQAESTRKQQLRAAKLQK